MEVGVDSRPGVAAAVSKAGGLGVLGCVRFNDAEDLEAALLWMDENTDGKPYGVDVVMPMNIPTEGTSVDLRSMIPEGHVSFVDKTLQKLGVPPLPEDESGREGVLGWLHSIARAHVEVALSHRPVLIANALGSPPKDVIDEAHEHGVKVAALAGAAKQRFHMCATASTSSWRRGTRPGATPEKLPAWFSRQRSSTPWGPRYRFLGPAASGPDGR